MLMLLLEIRLSKKWPSKKLFSEKSRAPNAKLHMAPNLKTVQGSPFVWVWFLFVLGLLMAGREGSRSPAATLKGRTPTLWKAGSWQLWDHTNKFQLLLEASCRFSAIIRQNMCTTTEDIFTYQFDWPYNVYIYCENPRGIKFKMYKPWRELTWFLQRRSVRCWVQQEKFCHLKSNKRHLSNANCLKIS